MPSSASFPRSNRKRSHQQVSLTKGTGSSLDSSSDVAAAYLSPDSNAMLSSMEPATHRARRDVMTVQLETLQAELDHERNLRALDQKRFQQAQQRMERQVEFAIEEAQEAKALMEETREQSDEYAATLRQQHKLLQDKFRKLQDALDVERANRADEDAEVDPHVEQLQAQLDARQAENQGLHETLADLRKQVQSLTSQLASTKSGMNDAAGSLDVENAVLRASPAPPQVMKELNHVRIQLAEVERKNRQWKRRAEEWDLKAKEAVQTQERLQSMKSRIDTLEQQLKDNHAKHATVQAEIVSWKEFGIQIGQALAAATNQPMPPGSSKDVPPEISVIRRYLNAATKDAVQFQAQNQQLQTQLEQADDKLQSLDKTIRELKQAKTTVESQQREAEQHVQVLKQQIQVSQSQEAVWKREVASLRSIVESFDELALPGKTAGSSSAHDARLRLLQTDLTAATEELQIVKQAQGSLQQELDTALTAKAQLQTKHDTVLEKFAKLKEAVYAERAKSEKAEARAVQAETLAGKGSFDPHMTRVVHMQHNPLTEALKQEIVVLKRQVEALTASNSSGSKKKHGTPGSAVVVVSGTPGPDIDPNKLHQRLKESFKEQIGRFREGVYLLTGYKIDMIPEGERPKFKVRSVFAEREQDHLMFQWPTVTPVESLDLLDTELAKLLTRTPSYEYVTRFHSIPAFLASTQLSLFEKQTIM